jgi:hypothetical protein
MKKTRSRNFVVAIIVGVILGLALGWLVIKPRPAEFAPITQLRPDFRTDAVLMVAENYARNRDKMFALDQLARLNHGDLLTYVGEALQNGETYGYSGEDMALIKALLEGLDLVVYENWKILRGWDG